METDPVDSTGLTFHLQKQFFIDIHIEFFSPKKNYTITESNENTRDEMIENGKKFDYLLEPLDYNVPDYAYVVYDQNYGNATMKIKEYLELLELIQ